LTSLDSNVFRLETRADGVLVALLDMPGESVNTLRGDFATRFDELCDAVEASAPKAVVIASAKRGSFIAGADVKLLRGVETEEQAAELSRTGQRVLSRIERSSVPMVAAIHGACLGGGLEIALACHARVASLHAKTKLGLPEVQLGLLPGLGGTQRLPRLVGVQAALDLMLTGRQLDARRAERIGLVDETVPPAIVVDVAASRALALASGPRQKKHGLGAWKSWFDAEELTELALADNPLGRKVLFDQARKRLHARTHGNYPAPDRILDVVKLGLERGEEQGYAAEARAFGALAMSSQARELMYLFIATNELKKDSGVSGGEAEARTVNKVGVLGAGLMGAGIAYVSVAEAHVSVRLKDRDTESLRRGLSYVRKIVDERGDRRRTRPWERERVMRHVAPTTDYSGFRDAAIVIEAVFEDLELKQNVLRDVEAYGHKEAIFASNTSSIPIARIAEAAKHPERVIGMHYFSPVHKMPLLEVIVTDKTAAWVTATVVAFGKRQQKTVIVVRDGVGFYTSRVLAPYMNEAAFLLAEGVDIKKIDEALVHFGFPVGPLTLLDEVGIDVGHKVGSIMQEAFGERMQLPPGMAELYADKRFGRKNQRGFYRYDGKHKGEKPVDTGVYATLGVRPELEKTPSEIAQRCVLQMVYEAVHCLGDGVLRNVRDGDIGAVFGLGFPAFLGGPFRYVDSIGVAEVLRRLERYERQFGSRFRPAPLLVQMAERGDRFHGAAG
jgi:3-hydroxyacyl-CoA dehydrogenase/enoyl-CoA hydratase/3-hydroxybutyryl-CoA epimerase